MSLETLLGEWAGLEPERCRQDGYAIGDHPAYQVLHEGVWHYAHAWSSTPAVVLQAAVQEAIEARGWSYSLSSFVQTDASFARVATVWPNRRQLGSHSEGDSSSPAVALLSAHLAALEHEKETP